MTGPVRPFTGAPAGIPGQNGPQQQPHPTIGNLGLMPGGLQPQGVVQPQQPQQPQYQSQQLHQANPQQSIPQNLPPMPGQGVQQHPTIPLNPQPPQNPQFQQSQPQYQNQSPALPNYQPQQPQPQSPQFQNGQGQRFEIPDNAIMDGPNVPPELRGRPWGQVRQIYGALASQFLAGRQQPQIQPQQPEPQQSQQPQAGRPQAPREGNGSGFWSDPEGTIARVVDQRINTAMAPVQQQSMQQAAEQAMRVAASGISDWQALYPEIIQVVSESGADPRSLGDPRIWNNAADLARGRMAGRGQYQPQNGVVPAPQPVRGPGAYVPAQVAPPVGQFFAEAPTPPQNQFNGPGQFGQNQLTAEEDFYRQKSGLTPEEFVSWRNVIQRVR